MAIKVKDHKSRIVLSDISLLQVMVLTKETMNEQVSLRMWAATTKKTTTTNSILVHPILSFANVGLKPKNEVSCNKIL